MSLPEDASTKATRKPIPQIFNTPLAMILDLSSMDLEYDYLDLSEWTLERIPKKVNIKRIELDDYNMADGWVYGWYNGSGK